MKFMQLKIGELYIQPSNSRGRFIWSDLKLRPNSLLLGTLKPLDIFVLLEISEIKEYKCIQTKILTTSEIIGWVEWSDQPSLILCNSLEVLELSRNF